MTENVMDQIVAELRVSAAKFYPQHAELRNVRVVGHTPKTDHFIYDIVLNFGDGNARVAAKVYPNKSGAELARNKGRQEFLHPVPLSTHPQNKNPSPVPPPL